CPARTDRGVPGRQHEAARRRDQAARGAGGEQRSGGRGGHDARELHAPHGPPRGPHEATVHLESHRIGELGGGDGVAAGDLECQAEVHRRGKRKAWASDHRRDEQRDPDAEHAGTPLHEAPEESGPIGREQQRGKDSGHEEDERVQQGQDAEASGRLAEQIDRESRRDPASGGITRVRVHEGDVLVHAGALTGAGYRRSSRALLSNRSVKSSRSWVSASSWRWSWTPRSTSSSRAVTSADADCGRAARRRASLRTVTAGIPTNIRRAVRNTTGSKWLSSFVRFLIYVRVG